MIGEVCRLCIVLLLFGAGCLAVKSPYDVLGVSRNAPIEEIKRAYKSLARKWHPDRNKDTGSQDKFVEVSAAYEILSDSEKREKYDRYGATGDDQAFGRNESPFGRRSGQFRAFRTQSGEFYFEGDPFEHFFRQQQGFNHAFREPPLPLSTRIWNKLQKIPGAVWEYVQDNPWGTVLALGTLMVLPIWIKFETDSAQKNKKKEQEQKKPKVPIDRFIFEMNVQTYHQLLKGQLPGCRTAVILVDDETQKELVKCFALIMKSYVRNPRWKFAYLNLNKYLYWYEDLLRRADVITRSIDQVDIHRTRGTVLILNNVKGCFSYFHSKIETDKKKNSRYDGAEFLGYSSSSDSDIESRGDRVRDQGHDEELTSELLSRFDPPVSLAGLLTWFEQLLDGHCTRINVMGGWPPLLAYR